MTRTFVVYINDLVTRAIFELEQFYDWATANRLTINTDKTFTMTVTNKRLPSTLPAVTINDITIPSQISGKLFARLGGPRARIEFAAGRQ